MNNLGYSGQVHLGSNNGLTANDTASQHTNQASTDDLPYILGIDAGGTKTQAVLWKTEVVKSLIQYQPAEQEVMGAAQWQESFPGINLDAIDAITANQRIASLLERAGDVNHLSLARFLQSTKVIMGMAGLDTDQDLRRAELWLRTAFLHLGVKPQQFTLVADIELALWSANLQGVGIVLIAGTGSNCFGRNHAGQSAKTGGMSQYFSDEGGGFMLGWEALHQITKMYDGRLSSSALLGQVLAAYNVPDFPSLKNKIVNAPDPKKAVAQAAPVVQALAKQGESSAKVIVDKAVFEMKLMIKTVWEKLQTSPQDNQLPVFLVGGLFKDQFYQQLLINELQAEGISAQFRWIEHPVVGAVFFN